VPGLGSTYKGLKQVNGHGPEKAQGAVCLGSTYKGLKRRLHGHRRNLLPTFRLYL